MPTSCLRSLIFCLSVSAITDFLSCVATRKKKTRKNQMIREKKCLMYFSCVIGVKFLMNLFRSLLRYKMMLNVLPLGKLSAIIRIGESLHNFTFHIYTPTTNILSHTSHQANVWRGASLCMFQSVFRTISSALN